MFINSFRLGMNFLLRIILDKFYFGLIVGDL